MSGLFKHLFNAISELKNQGNCVHWNNVPGGRMSLEERFALLIEHLGADPSYYPDGATDENIEKLTKLVDIQNRKVNARYEELRAQYFRHFSQN